MKKVTLVATLTTPPSADGEALRRLPAGVGVLEVRADLVGDLDPDWLRDRFPGKLLYTLRSHAEGGGFDGGKAARRRRLAPAAERFDLVDLEGDRDLFPELLVEVPARRRLISWHGPTSHLSDLQRRFETFAATEARYYKMIPAAVQSGDGIRPLALLQAQRRADLVAFASGEVGTWTRLVAPYLGSPLVYGALGDVPGAPGQLTIERLIQDYALPRLPPVERLYGIAGRPVLHSLSPRLHNGAYRTYGLPALYVPFHVESFGDFWLDVVEAGSLDVLDLPLRGISVTSPYKEVALAVSGVSSPRAQHIAAANTLVLNEDGVWEAETTDPGGVVLLLDRHGVPMRGAATAVVGCGGAGKAAAYGLQIAGARVTLINRDLERGRKAAEEMALPFVPLAAFDPAGFDLVIHATSLGHHDDDPLPFDPDKLDAGATVVDLVYGERSTPLMHALRARGLRGLGGRSVLLFQALEQFRLMTGRELPEDLAREILGLEEDA